MRRRILRKASWLVPIVVGAAFVLASFADEPPPGEYDAARTAAERVQNEKAYAKHVLPGRQGLVTDHLGSWIVLAGGRAFPVNEHGTAVRPAATMEEAVAAAQAAVPDARHRFVFRVGEEGDFRQPLGGAELPHVLGVWFLAKLERPDVEIRGFGPGQPIHFVKGDVRVEITSKGPDRRMFVRPEVGPPGGAGRADAHYGLSTGFGGYAVMPSDTAAGASLHLWEVPGAITIEGVFQHGACRRARARLRFPGTDLDFLLPVAVWPERPSTPSAEESEDRAAAYENPLTGAIEFGAWSEAAAGLQCRLGTDDTRFRIGGSTPLLLLQVKNVGNRPILAPDLFQSNMLVSGCPTKAVVHGHDFQWVFDRARLREPLPPGGTVEAVCRLQRTLLRVPGECRLHVGIRRGIRDPNTVGHPPRHPDWWCGEMTTKPLGLVGRTHD